MKKLFQTYSYSQRALFAACPRKYSYKYVEDLRESQGVVTSFSSDCVHPLLQAVHLENDALFMAPSYFERWRDKSGFVETLQYPQCSLATLQKILKAYIPMVEQDRAEGWQCVGTELSRVLPEHQDYDVFRYTAKVDVLEQRGTQLRPIEFKFSTGRPTTTLWEMDNQIVGYAACCGVREVMVVEIRAEKGWKGESGKVTVGRGAVQITDDMIAEWKTEMEQERENLLYAFEENVWPKNTASCQNYGRLCEYSSLCRAGAARRFITEQWPQREREEKKYDSNNSNETNNRN